ncbi:MAG: DUF222 domain-containing protein [Actinobacteria bacterium]|nr:DUF222 domain-containing protein [Actinomycetota bacterium]
MQQQSSREAELIEGLHSLHFVLSVTHRKILTIVSELDERKLWRDEGCRDMAQWLSGQLGISAWIAARWVAASHAIPKLPLVSQALESGSLGLDKVVELCRFATSETEQELIAWARRVSVATVRHRADVFNRPQLEEVRTVDKARFLHWWWNQGGASLGLEGLLPAAEGVAVVKALERCAERLSESASEETSSDKLSAEGRREQRYADALWALSSQAIAEDPDGDRATVVVHTKLESTGLGSAEIEGGLGLHPDIAQRLSCDARLQFVVTDDQGNALGIGRASRNVPRWLHRQLLYRDHGCTFPGCGTKMFLKAHHIWHWELGGPTDYHNLVLVCTFHHKLVHEGGWSVCLKGRWRSGSSPPGGATTRGPIRRVNVPSRPDLVITVSPPPARREGQTLRDHSSSLSPDEPSDFQLRKAASS